MSTANWLQLAILIALLLVSTRVIGAYVAGVFGGGKALGDRVFLPVERLVYRVCGVDPEREQTWAVYAYSLLAFSLVSVLGLYALQRLQGSLPLNPTDASGVPPALAFNTAVSFVTNTNWQNYGGELTMSHLTQMAGLAVQNFVSAAVGLVCRGGADPRASCGGSRSRSGTSGSTSPAARSGCCCRSPSSSRSSSSARGSSRTSTASRMPRRCRARRSRSRAARSRARRRSRRWARTAAASTTPTRPIRSRTRTGSPNFLEIFLLLMIPFALTYTYGRLVKDQRQGWVLFAVMFAIWIGAAGLAMHWETAGNPNAPGHRRGRRQHGGQGGPLRHRGIRPLRRVDDGHVDRLRQLRPTTASRRSAAPCRWST